MLSLRSNRFPFVLLIDTVIHLSVQVEEEEDYYDGPDDSDYESDDSNGIR